MKIRIKGYVKDLSENKVTNIDTIGIKNKNKIIYKEEDNKHTIKINNNEIIYIRDGLEFSNLLHFKLDKITESEYLLKEQDYTISIPIKTMLLNIEENKFKVIYQVIDSEDEYEFNIEMSDLYEYKN